MRILYITDALAIWGGTERVLVEKANFLADNYNCDIHLITVNQGPHPILYPISDRVHYVDLDIRFHRQYVYRGLRRLIKRWQLRRLYINRLRDYINLSCPDIIVTTRTELSFGIIATKGTIPFLFESHSSFIAYRFQYNNWFSRQKEKFINYNLRYANVIVALTEGDANEWRCISSNVHVIPNIVHLNNSGQYSSCCNKSVIFVGRLARQKDVHSLLLIWSIVHKCFPDWQLQIYGGFSNEYDVLIDEIRNMRANVFLNDPTPNILDKYRENSILLLTSLFEPFGLVLPEAMSCGLPVVAFDCPYGPADIITDGVDGFLVKNRDVNEFADRVCQLIEDKGLRIRMGQAAIKSSQRYRADLIMPKWKELFERICPKE